MGLMRVLIDMQKLFKPGEMTCVFTGKTLSDAVVSAYNQFTSEYNRATREKDKNDLLDQRHKFLLIACYQNLNQA